MVQLKILSGANAGTEHVARRFPCVIGRASSADCRVSDAGVWDQHLELDLKIPTGFVLRLQPNALARVNGQPFEEILLRNGDLVEIGAVKIQFWLGELRQTSLAWRELATWLALAALCAVQLGLIYWLIR